MADNEVETTPAAAEGTDSTQQPTIEGDTVQAEVTAEAAAEEVPGEESAGSGGQDTQPAPDPGQTESAENGENSTQETAAEGTEEPQMGMKSMAMEEDVAEEDEEMLPQMGMQSIAMEEDVAEEEEEEEEEKKEGEVASSPVAVLNGDETAVSELTQEEKERYRQVFDRKAVNDRLDLKGFKVLFRLMGEVLSSEEAETMFQSGDRNDDSTIDFEEFCRLYSKYSLAEQERKEAMLTSIDKLFPGSDGQPVELKKVERLLLKLQQPDLDMRLVREKSDLNEGDVRSLVRAMDTDGNGYISKEEFVDTLCQHLDLGM